MTENKKTNDISRREFLKDAGLLVGGTAIGSITLLGACTEKEVVVTQTVTDMATTTVTGPATTVTSPPVTTTSPPVTVTFPPTTVTIKEDFSQTPPAKAYLVVDSGKCGGCQTCMLACSLVHEGRENTKLSRIQVIQDSYGHYPDDRKTYQCRQCVFPACVAACPTGACNVDTANGNIRTIDESKCIGCQRCVAACPYTPSRVIWNFETLKAQKCDLCANTPYWNEEGGVNGKQACVEICPQKAIQLTREQPSQVKDFGYEVLLR